MEKEQYELSSLAERAKGKLGQPRALAMVRVGEAWVWEKALEEGQERVRKR